jgi:hypothetical protein
MPFEPLQTYVEQIRETIGASAGELYIIHHDQLTLEWYTWNQYDPALQPLRPSSQFNVYSVQKTSVLPSPSPCTRGKSTGWTTTSRTTCPIFLRKS